MTTPASTSPPPTSPPDLDTDAHQRWPFGDRCALVVGIGGGSASGKTSVARALLRGLGEARAHLIEHDHYYHDLSHLPAAARLTYNYDHPSALETALLIEHLDHLCGGRAVWCPRYSYQDQRRTPDAVRFEPRPILLVEGIMVLQDPDLRARMDLRIFVDAPEEARLSRRVARDQRHRGYTEDQIRRQFAATVKPMHDEYVQPSRTHADLIIPDGYNPAAVGILIHALRVISSARAAP